MVALGVVATGVIAVPLVRSLVHEEPLFRPRISAIEVAPMCPWRDPAVDLERWFAGATNYVAETRILSGKRPELTRALRRPPTPEENAVKFFRVRTSAGSPGFVFTRRVKGERGGIELVTALDHEGAVRGVSIQSHRENAATAQILSKWLEGFIGKTATNDCQVGVDLPPVPETARRSANAIADGIHSVLVLHDIADHSADGRAARRLDGP